MASSAPKTHGDRQTCIDAVARVRSLVTLPAALKTLIVDVFEPVAVAFDAARASNDAASFQVAKAMKDKNDADAVFVAAFRHWLHSSYDGSSEQAVLKELKPHMGNASPSKFLDRKVQDRLAHMHRLDLHVRGHAHLTGNLQRLDALRDATAALAAAVKVWEGAVEAHTAASTACTAATAAFDKAYGNLARSIKQIDARATQELPTFHRVSKPRKPKTPTADAAPEPAAE